MQPHCMQKEQQHTAASQAGAGARGLCWYDGCACGTLHIKVTAAPLKARMKPRHWLCCTPLPYKQGLEMSALMMA
jgi:hypothetical protein